jgi:hypothetical protein
LDEIDNSQGDYSGQSLKRYYNRKSDKCVIIKVIILRKNLGRRFYEGFKAAGDKKPAEAGYANRLYSMDCLRRTLAIT